jgi:hypothetical protein
MPGSFLEVEPRSFNPMSVPGLTNEVREAVNAALKAMSTWRNEIADNSEKNGKRVIEKKSVAVIGGVARLPEAFEDPEHVGTYVIPFPCRWRDGLWETAKTSRRFEATVVGWRALNKAQR